MLGSVPLAKRGEPYGGGRADKGTRFYPEVGRRWFIFPTFNPSSQGQRGIFLAPPPSGSLYGVGGTECIFRFPSRSGGEPYGGG